MIRGKWILENLLGSQAPLPPPDVPPLEEKPTAAREVRARTHRAAPRESGVRRLPQDHGPDRTGARELRRDRPLAHDRRGRRRSMRPGSSWTARRSTDRRACARRCSIGRTRSSRSMTEKLLMYGVGREIEVLRHARRAHRHARRGEEPLPLLGSGHGHREERAVSDEDKRTSEDVEGVALVRTADRGHDRDSRERTCLSSPRSTCRDARSCTEWV